MAKQKIHSSQLTYEDYLQFPDDGKRHEIIEGDHYMTPAPKTKHQRISGNLATAMITVSKQHKLGLVLTAPCDVVLSDENVVQPDLLFVATARAAVVTDDNIQGAPDLIVEILSESSRKKDEVTKRKLYERFGVQEYWIVDPELEIVKIFKLTQQGYGRASELSKETNDVLTTELLPGFDCAVSEIFE
ncbi:MAG: Uma2 family endonuclease [Deltaproteobacteria bacterium]|nr:Uma2 family endonuclease [Deltaproteobacteria bacterium]MBI3064687.1 Uma2 family endonuclease [Deltaproteobacteria bacterium]